MADAILCVSGIYAIRNMVTGKVYVGSAGRIKARFVVHRSQLNRGVHPNEKLQRAWVKYGAEAFAFEVLEMVAHLGELVAREQHWIDSLGAVTGGYNIRKHAENNRGLKASEETRRKMSLAQTGRRHSAETKARMSQSKKGVPIWSAEERAAMSEARTGRTHTAEALAKIAAASTGRKRSPESIRKGEEARRATIAKNPIQHTDAARMKMSLSKKGLPAKNRKPVEVFGVSYASIDEAARTHGRTPAWVKARIKGVPCRPLSSAKP